MFSAGRCRRAAAATTVLDDCVHARTCVLAAPAERPVARAWGREAVFRRQVFITAAGRTGPSAGGEVGYLCA